LGDKIYFARGLLKEDHREDVVSGIRKVGQDMLWFFRDKDKRAETVLPKNEVVQIIFVLCLAGNSQKKI